MESDEDEINIFFECKIKFEKKDPLCRIEENIYINMRQILFHFIFNVLFHKSSNTKNNVVKKKLYKQCFFIFRCSAYVNVIKLRCYFPFPIPIVGSFCYVFSFFFFISQSNRPQHTYAKHPRAQEFNTNGNEIIIAQRKKETSSKM